jgi:YhcG PDDEXK nuclease domain
VALVFYNRLLRCYVIIDLTLDKLMHEDLGQMQLYVNYFDREVKLPGENPTIGLLLCKSKKQTVVELTLPKDANIHAREPERSGDRLPQAARRASEASQYQLYLPSKELLKQKPEEWSTVEARRNP